MPLKNNSTIWSWVSIVLILLFVLFMGIVDLRAYLATFVSNQDKYLHFFTFFALVFICKALFPQFEVYKVALAILLFSLLLEILQELFTHGLRHFHFSDIMANLLGIALATLIVLAVSLFRNNSPAN